MLSFLKDTRRCTAVFVPGFSRWIGCCFSYFLKWLIDWLTWMRVGVRCRVCVDRDVWWWCSAAAAGRRRSSSSISSSCSSDERGWLWAASEWLLRVTAGNVAFYLVAFHHRLSRRVTQERYAYPVVLAVLSCSAFVCIMAKLFVLEKERESLVATKARIRNQMFKHTGRPPDRQNLSSLVAYSHILCDW